MEWKTDWLIQLLLSEARENARAVIGTDLRLVGNGTFHTL